MSRPRPLLRSAVLAAWAAVVAGAVTALPAPAQADRAPVVLPAWTCTDAETAVLAGVSRASVTAQCDMQPLPVDDPPVHWVTQCMLTPPVLPAGAGHSVARASAMKPGAVGPFTVEFASEAPFPVGEVSTTATCAARSEAGDSQESATYPFTVHVVDEAPSCDDDTLQTAADTALTVALACDETYGTREVTSAPQHGTVTGFDGPDSTEVVYTPAPGFSGTDSFVVTSTNPAGSDTATVTVTVTAPPVTAPIDTDGDRLSDAQEEALGTDPRAKDTDGDGLGDGREVRGIEMAAKVAFGVRRAQGRPVGLVRPDPLRADTDGDGLDDGVELRLRRVGQTVLTPLSSYVIGTRVTNPVRADSDRDGLTDREELTGSANRRHGSAPSDPMRADTDMGGIRDGSEVRRGSDPVDARGTGAAPARRAG